MALNGPFRVQTQRISGPQARFGITVTGVLDADGHVVRRCSTDYESGQVAAALNAKWRAEQEAADQGKDARVVAAALLTVHALPWQLELAAEGAVIKASGALIMKCETAEQATKILSSAQELSASAR